jgi:hypothetical protein
MKTLSVSALIVLSAMVIYSQQPQASGPFGFEYGMSKDKAIEIIGKVNVIKDRGDTVTFSTAPKPHSDFERYTVIFSPTSGLLSIDASFPDIKTGVDGEDLKSKYDAIKKSLTSVYGPPSVDLNGNKSSNTGDFMTLLLRGDQVMECSWSLTNNAHHVVWIGLDTSASSSTIGSISLYYKFAGIFEYVKTRKAESVL